MQRTHQLQLRTGLALRDWPQQHIVYVGNRGLLALLVLPGCAQPDQDVARVQVRVLHMAMQCSDQRCRCTNHKRLISVVCPLGRILTKILPSPGLCAAHDHVQQCSRGSSDAHCCPHF